MAIETLNFISVIITIGLFLLFLLGKIATSTRENIYHTEILTMDPKTDLLEKLNIVDEFVENGYEKTILLHSKEVLFNVKLIKIDPKNFKASRPKGEVVKEIKKLYPNEGFIIKAYFTCGMPNYVITWDKYNYMKAIFYIQENGLCGIGKLERVLYLKTIRSRVYHFIRQ